jgi:hypothetical protein
MSLEDKQPAMEALGERIADIRGRLDLGPERGAAWRPPVDASWSGDLEGWVLRDSGDGCPVGWLAAFDSRSWEALAVSAREAWVMAPEAGRHASEELVAVDLRGNLVAHWHRWTTVKQHGTIGYGDVRLELPLTARLGGRTWRLTDDHGPLARVAIEDGDPGWLRAKSGGWLSTHLAFEWTRVPSSAELMALVITYSAVLRRAMIPLIPVNGGGG